MSAAVLATVLAALSGPAAVFWSGGRTYVVDADAGRLYFAAGWYASDGDRVHRYRLQTHTSRRESRGDASRWTTLEHTVVGSRTWSVVDEGPVDDPGHDERVVLQFLGERAVIGRYARSSGGRWRTAATWHLPSGGPVHPPTEADRAVSEVAARLGGEGTALRAHGVVERELAGGRTARWLVLADARGQMRAQALDRPKPFRPEIELRDVADLRPSPDGELAVVLQGAPLGGEAWRIDDLLSLHDPCDTRRLLLWRARRPPLELGEVARLDGARWLDEGDPLRALVATRFLPAASATCFAPLTQGPPSAPTAHRCRVDEVDRAWGGPADLAAGVGLRLEERAEVRIDVQDAERLPGDAVRVFFGGGRPESVSVSPDGVEGHGGARRRVELRAAVRGEWRPVEGGYTVTVQIPLDLVGDPPAISVRVTDQDADGTVQLWAAGDRVSAHQPRATPVTP